MPHALFYYSMRQFRNIQSVIKNELVTGVARMYCIYVHTRTTHIGSPLRGKTSLTRKMWNTT